MWPKSGEIPWWFWRLRRTRSQFLTPLTSPTSHGENSKQQKLIYIVIWLHFQCIITKWINALIFLDMYILLVHGMLFLLLRDGNFNFHLLCLRHQCKLGPFLHGKRSFDQMNSLLQFSRFLFNFFGFIALHPVSKQKKINTYFKKSWMK